MERISVIGAGSWGIALANLLAGNGHDVTVWSIMKDEIEISPFSLNLHSALTDTDVPSNLLLIELTSLTKATACSMCDRFVVSICCLFLVY